MTVASSAPRLLRALRSRNYRLYFAGQGVSLIGTWLTRIATAWLVYKLTNSAFLLGLVGFAGQVPTFAIAPFAGVIVDRRNKHRILVITQILSLIQSAALAVLTLGHWITVWQIIWLSVFQGLINCFDMPARQAFLIDIVENREDLANAIALNSSMVNGSRLLGPSLAGILIAVVGEGWCFGIDAVSYIAVVAALLMMTLPPYKPHGRTTSAMEELKQGLRYAFGFAPIRAVLLLLAVLSLLGMSYTVLMPVFATQVLHGGSQTLGFLMAASGIGALAGALYLASRTTVLGLGRIIAGSSVVFGLSLIGFAYSHYLWLSLGMMLVTGSSMIIDFASSNTVLQTITQDELRGRVMSLFGMAFMGMAPFGSLVAGYLAEPHRLGPTHTVALTGIGCILAGLVFAAKIPSLRKLVLPIYAEKGILPPVATALQTATDMKSPPEET